MTLHVVQENAEKELLRTLEAAMTQAAARSVMLCQFSHTKIAATPEMLMPILNDILKDQEAIIYFCHDGDAIIYWKGFQDQVVKGLTTTLPMLFKDRLGAASKEQVFRYFEPFQHENELIALARGKIIQKDIAATKPENAAVAMPPVRKPMAHMELLHFTAEQKDSLNEALSMRKRRRGIEILVVEDQGFSRKLLMSMLERNYRCREAATAEEAIKLYATYAPDLCFLDIELPDGSGHALAHLFRTHDTSGHLVMITANKFPHDVDIAVKNAVQGFIYKPYSKNRIYDIVNNVVKRANKINA